MMSSGEKARAPREKLLPPAVHTPPPQRHIQATAEQMRLAQMIYDKNDADFEDKVNQLMEVTGKNQDECLVALHDCNEDVSRAINFLLESPSDMTSWETVGKRRPLVKEVPLENKENKENREKKERESSKGRGSAGRKGKGINRSRQGSARPEENGVEGPQGERGSERSRRLRGGRGSGGRGRGRAAGSRFSAQGMGTFNPADYPSEAGTGSTSQTENWDSAAQSNNTDGTVAWRSTLEDWAAEDWSEDVSLSETKVFTSSCAAPAENHISPGQSLDLASLLQKPVVGGGRDPPPSSSSQSLVFTNSHHHQTPQVHPQPPHQPGRSSTSYAHAALSSVLGAGFGDLGQSKRPPPSAGAQILEQLKGPGLGQLPSSQAAPPPAHPQTGGSCVGLTGPPHPSSSSASSSWDMKSSQSSSSSVLSSQFSREFVRQPEPSLVLSQLVQRHSGPPLPLARQPSPPSQTLPPSSNSSAPPHPGTPPQNAAAPKPSAPGAGLDPQGSSASQQRTQLKGQKRRIPPTSKIPSSAVEMPGSADVPGLNLQFGALDFGSESLPEFGVADRSVAVASREAPPAASSAPPAVTQSQSSLYSKPLSDALSSPLSLSDPVYHSASAPLPSLSSSSSLSSASSTVTSSSSSGPSPSPFSSVGGAYEASLPPHSRLGFSQSKEPAVPVLNGLNGVRTSAALDTSSASSTPKPESPALSLSSGPSSHLPPSLSSHSSALSALSQELPTAPLSNLSSHSSVSALGSSSHTYTSVENSSSVSSLAPSSGSYASSQPPAPTLHSTHSSSSSSNSSGISNSISSSTMTHLSSVPMVNSLSGSGLHPVAPSGSNLHPAPPSNSTALGLSANGAAANLSAPRTTALLSSSTGKAPPNLSQGVPPLLPNQYIMGPGGLLPAYPQIYGYEDLHMLQSRLPMPSLQDYYGITFPGPTAALSGRDSLTNNPYSGEVNKFGRNDSTSPAPPTSVAAAQPPQPQSQGQTQPPQGPPQGQPHGSQAFLPPGYSYTGLPYYPAVPGTVPSAAAFQYGPTVFVPPGGPGPASKQHNMGLGLGNPSSPFQQQSQQQPGGYGQHAFSSGYEELNAGPAAVDYGKGYSSASQAQAKSVSSGPKGVSVTSSNSGVPDISGSVYNKTQQGFHAATPPPFSLPSALGGPGPLNPGAPPGGYAPAPFLHILPHQQLHHHLAQDGQGGPSQRQSSSLQPKSQVTKSSYGSSAYWAN